MPEPSFAETRERETALYRYFDSQDRLLYIGVALEFGNREQGHIKSSRWMQLAARSTITRLPSYREALDAERAAIETEHPLFNVRYNETPEAQERLAAYLEEIERMDLLKPPEKPQSAPSPGPAEPESTPAPSRYSDDALLAEYAEAPLVMSPEKMAVTGQRNRGGQVMLSVTNGKERADLFIPARLAHALGRALMWHADDALVAPTPGVDEPISQTTIRRSKPR